MLVRLLTSVLFGLAVGYASVRALGSAAARSAGQTVSADADTSEIRTRSRISSVRRRFVGQVREYFPWVVVSLALAAMWIA